MKARRPMGAYYVRVSHQKQIRRDVGGEDRGGLSFDAQQRAIRDLAHEDGVELNSAFCFEEVASASSPGETRIDSGTISFAEGRPVFRRLLEVLSAPQCETKILYVSAWDRLSRNEVDHLLVQQLITKHGVEIRDVRERRRINQDNLQQHALSLGVTNLTATQESSTRNQRVKEARQEKAAQGLFVGNKPPAGYQWQETRRRKATRLLELDPKSSPNVRRLFELAASGKHTLIELLEFSIDHNLLGRRAASSSVTKLISNPVYVGGFRWTPPGASEQVDVVEGNNPQLVSRDLFDRANAVLRGCSRRATKRTNRVFVLTALMECHQFGLRLSPHKPSKRSHVLYWTLRHDSINYSVGVQKRIHVRDELIVEELADYLDSISFPSFEIARAYADLAIQVAGSGEAEPARVIRDQLKKAERARARALRVLLDPEAKSAYGVAKKRLRELDVHVAALNERIDAASQIPRDLDLRGVVEGAVAMGRQWLRLDEKSQREYLLGILQMPQGKTDPLPIRYDWRKKRIIEVRLNPTWAAIRDLCAIARSVPDSGGRRGDIIAAVEALWGAVA